MRQAKAEIKAQEKTRRLAAEERASQFAAEQKGGCFAQSSKRSEHTNIHESDDEDELSWCKVCGRTFKLKDQLKRHTKIHRKDDEMKEGVADE